MFCHATIVPKTLDHPKVDFLLLASPHRLKQYFCYMLKSWFPWNVCVFMHGTEISGAMTGCMGCYFDALLYTSLRLWSHGKDVRCLHSVSS